MTAADDYRTLAALFRAKARAADNAEQAAEWDQLAQSYARLAEQAERNAELDLSVEIGPPLRLLPEDNDDDGDGREHT